MITNKVLKQRVQRGLDWIVADGGRFDMNLDCVDVATLNVGDEQTCVATQAYTGDASYAGEAVCGYLVLQLRGFTGPQLQAYGFSLNSWTADDDAYNRLTAVWREAILEHRASVAAMNQELEIALLEGVKV